MRTTNLHQDLVPSGMWLPVVIGILAIGSVLGVVILMTPTLREDNSEEAGRAEVELPSRSSDAAQEIERLGPSHPWAGLYYRGDGLGVNIRLWLAPQAGCVARWDGCLGLYGVNWGTVTEHNGVLRVAYENPDAPGEFGHFPSVFRLENDGATMRLVPDGESSDSHRVLVRQ